MYDLKLGAIGAFCTFRITTLGLRCISTSDFELASIQLFDTVVLGTFQAMATTCLGLPIVFAEKTSRLMSPFSKDETRLER